MDFNIQLPDEEERLRKAFRTRVPGLTARFSEIGLVLDVSDLSATGFAVIDKNGRFTERETYDVELQIKGRLFLGGTRAMCMRVREDGIVGLNFTDLERQKQIKLDKLVLEVQKRLIALRKKKREQG
ncbi:type IV pilus assembly PilZ [Pseudodesulfovibrio mercurii]|uniref:Type IV pilus assembly PilZ n=1 Tax=Pseudodesulfovibrio mercurii TaxID=641491 RepID=F0JDI1_9BACT|nr:PilZ domain-containing protein [Pseudodesulfovibrio mercurii]EGB13350.1 type IV pilus assembly PilZ [Pseudodesulfovibrio mercurii]